MSHAYCPTQTRHVSLDQTEGQCRERHSCSGDACPLEKNFQPTDFSRALEMMAAAIGHVQQRR